MITICCILWGDKYPNYYVENLKIMAERNISTDHDFICLTDRDLPGIETIRFEEKIDLPGWWQKLILFKEINSPFIYIDLDSLIINSIESLVEYTQFDLAMPYVFTPGKKGFQGSVICSNGKFSAPFDDFDRREFSLKPSKSAPYGSYGKDKIRGDQEYLTEFYSKKITPINSGIYSYKLSCLEQPPKGASVICFHGKPDYHEIETGWVSEYIKSHPEIKTK